MRSLLITGAIAVSIFSFDTLVIAAPLQTLKIYPGHGTTLNFRTSGEKVYKTWLDDPSQVTLDFDDPNCRTVTEKQPCAAQILHLRRINRLSFPGLPTTPTTTLTVVTDRNLYQFHLTFPNSGTPTAAIVEVQPTRPSSRSIIQRGLEVAVSRNLLNQGDALWKRVQLFLQLTEQGASTNQAAQQAGVSPQLIRRLTEFGQTTAL
jgi:hypothetical protein